MPYYVHIARFMPRVEIVQRQNSTVRRLYIQGHNGKVKLALVGFISELCSGGGEGGKYMYVVAE